MVGLKTPEAANLPSFLPGEAFPGGKPRQWVFTKHLLEVNTERNFKCPKEKKYSKSSTEMSTEGALITCLSANHPAGAANSQIKHTLACTPSTVGQVTLMSKYKYPSHYYPRGHGEATSPHGDLPLQMKVTLQARGPGERSDMRSTSSL